MIHFEDAEIQSDEVVHRNTGPGAVRIGIGLAQIKLCVVFASTKQLKLACSSVFKVSEDLTASQQSLGGSNDIGSQQMCRSANQYTYIM